jgi:Fe-S cluster biogenesis protein NfuA
MSTPQTEPVSISLEFTPNPNTLKFVVNRQLLPQGAANFLAAAKTEHAPLARKLFQVPGVQAVMIGTQFVTITKAPDGSWDVLAEQVPATLESHLSSGEAAFDEAYFAAASPAATASGSDVEQKIREVLDNEIRPAVAMDGGDITFGKFEDGIVYLHLQGSCSSCPSSVATLKMGVESRLREVVPEVKEVVQI